MSGKSAAKQFSPADDMAFHVLGEQGILFSEKRQELHLLDAAASYVWCGVREGMPLAAMAAGYAEACDLPVADAGRVVGDLLHRWLGLGYIRGPEVTLAAPIDLTTALGWLLQNPALRESFAADPRATAVRLRLRDEDLPLFVGLDPAQLDRTAGPQAMARNQDSENRPLALADEAVNRSAIRRYRTHDWSPPANRRHYRLGGSVFRIAFDNTEQESVIHPAFRHLEVPATSPDITFDVIAEKQGHVVLKNGEPAAFCNRLDRLARTALVPIRDAVIDRADYFLLIHAALASAGDACILLPASPGNGKSTLAAALARSGFRFFTDEIAMLDEATLNARPFPFPMVVKQGSVEPLRPWYPEIDSLQIALRENDQPVRYVPPPSSASPATDEERQPVRWIAFPRYDAGAKTSLQPLAPEDALARMLSECRIVKAMLDHENVAALIGWLGKTACYSLSHSSLTDAVRLLQELCRPTGSADPAGQP